MFEKIKTFLEQNKLVLWNNGKDQYLIVSNVRNGFAYFKHFPNLVIDLNNVFIDEFLIGNKE